ncbi:MAG: undecaprenyldiphospho-muramoylpentapeptide beta-N-acetylglucosaminyltransferase [Verrucomicrobiae bacterium]|nr:undecaprenyldiphospho-muramoylpentapeptide beta-N-acetylglucosaminyltransferase [Verrucomicrobiae bacterium]
MNIVIACGGTGGHLFPGLAVAEVLKGRGHDVLLFVSSKSIDEKALASHREFSVEKLTVVGMPRLLSWKFVVFVWRFVADTLRCLGIYGRFRPAAVLAMGGFTAVPPVLAARLRGIPSLLHDSNAIPGRANRLIGRLVSASAIGLEDCRPHFRTPRVELTGTPLRRALTVEAAGNPGAFGLDPAKKTILVLGGSQGASGINRIVCWSLDFLKDLRDQWQFAHISGEADLDFVTQEYRESGLTHYVAAFTAEMGGLYRIADLVISRSGAASLTEIAYFGLPSVLIPYPLAADDHQTRNAQVFVRAGASRMFRQNELEPHQFADSLRAILHDGGLADMGRHARALHIADAEQKVADLVVEVAAR